MKSPRQWAMLRRVILAYIWTWEKTTRIKEMEIRWPSGIKQVLQDVAVDRILTVEEPQQITILVPAFAALRVHTEPASLSAHPRGVTFITE